MVLKSDPDGVPDAVRELALSRPDAVLVAGEPGPVARVLLAQLALRLPDATVVASPGLAAAAGEGSGATAVTALLPAEAQPPRGLRVLRRLGKAGRPEALYGYDAMRTVVEAVAEGGGDRRAVVRAALRPSARRGTTGTSPWCRAGTWCATGWRSCRWMAAWSGSAAPRPDAVVQPVGTPAARFARRAKAGEGLIRYLLKKPACTRCTA